MFPKEPSCPVLFLHFPGWHMRTRISSYPKSQKWCSELFQMKLLLQYFKDIYAASDQPNSFTLEGRLCHGRKINQCFLFAVCEFCQKDWSITHAMACPQKLAVPTRTNGLESHYNTVKITEQLLWHSMSLYLQKQINQMRNAFTFHIAPCKPLQWVIAD